MQVDLADYDAGRPIVKMLREGRLLAVHALHPGAHPVFPVPSFGIDDAFMVSTHLRPMQSDVWRNGRQLDRLFTVEGSVQFFDLRQSWRAVLHPPFETINLRISRQMLADAAGTTVAALEFMPEPIVAQRIDATMLALARSLLPAFSRSGDLSALFVERVVLAAAAHVVHAYGELKPETLLRPRAGLAPWQQRRVAQMLLTRLHAEVTLAELAAECGLSASYFARAFKLSFGMPPHRWLLRERVRRAATLMTETAQPIDEIAVACGFVDQSHLTRVFRRVMHVPPAAWRRTQRQQPSTVTQS